jgi:hypothetical protein
MIPKEAITEYQSIYFKKYGVELTNEEAEQQVRLWLGFYDAVLPKETDIMGVIT